MSEVKIVKFVYGAEVIAKVSELDERTVMLQSPLSLQPIQRQDSMSLAMMPFTWAGETSNGVAIERRHILCIMDCEDGLKSSYLANLAGLTIPSQTASPRITLTD